MVALHKQATPEDALITVERHPMDDCVAWVAPDLEFAVVNSDLPPEQQAVAVAALEAFARALKAAPASPDGS